MTEAQEAHFAESQLQLEEFVKLIDYAGLTPAQRLHGSDDIAFIYERRTAPTPIDAVFHDTHERGGRFNFHTNFDPTQSDWYPDIEEPVEAGARTQHMSAGAVVVDLALRRGRRVA